MATFNGTATFAGLGALYANRGQASVTRLGGDNGVVKVSWEALTYEASPERFDFGVPAAWDQWSDRSVQVLGTFGGTTLVFEGSNDDGETWATLTDAAGNALSFTAAGLKAVTERTALVRPRVTASGTAVDLDIHMVARRPQEIRS